MTAIVSCLRRLMSGEEAAQEISASHQPARQCEQLVSQHPVSEAHARIKRTTAPIFTRWILFSHFNMNLFFFSIFLFLLNSTCLCLRFVYPSLC